MNPGTGSVAILDLLWQAIRPLVLPIALLAGAWLLGNYLDRVPASLSGLIPYVPYVLLAIAALLGAAFGRSKILLTAALLACAQMLLDWQAHHGALVQVQKSIGDLALIGLIPFNFGIVSWYAERGITSGHGWFRAGLILVQVIIVTVLLVHPLPELDRLITRAWIPQGDLLDRTLVAPFTQTNVLLFVVGCALSIACAYLQSTTISFGLLGAFAGYLATIVHAAYTGDDSLFPVVSGLLLTIALLRDSYNMAFRDELTALPQRRALREQLMGLAGRYTLAMVDVDHFKKFNDQYGHDIGDQVLQMVAAQIRQVKGGGRAYRYGGEEFSIVFPRKGIDKTLPHLEEVRQRVAEYRMVIRGTERQDDARDNAKRSRKRGSFRAAKKQVGVTISIGAAERRERAESPDDVLKRADQALYQAKHKGRNRVVS